MSDVFQYRDFDRARDEKFLFDTWLKTFRHSLFAGPLPRNLYYHSYRAAIEQLLARGAKVTIAFDPTDVPPDDNWGYVCTEDGYDLPVVHYLYVKDEWRTRGVGRRILAHAIGGESPFYYTFKTKAAAKFFEGGILDQDIARLTRAAYAKRQRHRNRYRGRGR